MVRGRNIVGFPYEREIAGIICNIPMKRKYTKDDTKDTICEFGELFHEIERNKREIIVFRSLYFVVQNLWVRNIRNNRSI